MRQAGVDVQALRPLRGRLTPEPGPRHRPTATNGHRRRAKKKDLGTSTARLDDGGATDKQGSKLVRWAAIEACQHVRVGSKLAADRSRIIATRGRNIGVVAAARRLLTLVFYGLRDGEIRALAAGAA
jgi:hypothetical protein